MDSTARRKSGSFSLIAIVGIITVTHVDDAMLVWLFFNGLQIYGATPDCFLSLSPDHRHDLQATPAFPFVVAIHKFLMAAQCCGKLPWFFCYGLGECA